MSATTPLVLLVSAVLSAAAPNAVTCEEFRALPPDAQTVYLYGFMNGLASLGRVSVLMLMASDADKAAVDFWMHWFDSVSTMRMSELRAAFLRGSGRVGRAYAEFIFTQPEGAI